MAAKSFAFLLTLVVLSMAAIATALTVQADVASAPTTINEPEYDDADIDDRKEDSKRRAHLHIEFGRNVLCITPPKPSTPILGAIAKVVCRNASNEKGTLQSAYKFLSSPANEDAYGFFSNIVTEGLFNCKPFLNGIPLPECINHEINNLLLESRNELVTVTGTFQTKVSKLSWLMEDFFRKYPKLTESCCSPLA